MKHCLDISPYIATNYFLYSPSDQAIYLLLNSIYVTVCVVVLNYQYNASQLSISPINIMFVLNCLVNPVVSDIDLIIVTCPILP
jgi:hypothetical protein